MYDNLCTKQAIRVRYLPYNSHLCSMGVQEFLKNTKDINLTQLARKMWPNNADAESYLIRKVNGQRPFTRKDADLAKKYLKELGVQINSLE